MSRSDLKRMTLVATAAGCIALAGTAFAQMQPATPAKQVTPSNPAASTQMQPGTPKKSEPASLAFKQLDVSHRGYVTKQETAALQGFDKAFNHADKNKDGKLSPAEFKVAWAAYATSKQAG
jgi:EF hand